MILSGEGFAQAVEQSVWKVYRENERIFPDKLYVGTNSVDVRLSRYFSRVLSRRRNLNEMYWIDPEQEDSAVIQDYEGDQLLLRPDEFWLARTQERFETSRPLRIHSQYTQFVQMYDGRSTMARLGIISHCTAGFGDAGYCQPWTLELRNLGNDAVMLRAGMRIGQISFHSLTHLGNANYSGVYNDSSVFPTPPQLGKGRV